MPLRSTRRNRRVNPLPGERAMDCSLQIVVPALCLLSILPLSLLHPVATAQACSCNTSVVWNALKAFYDSTGGPQWTRSDNWLAPGSTVCDWYGFSSCADVTLTSNNLRGTLPAALSSVPDVRAVNLANNSLSGSFPPEYSGWGASLIEFNVGHNNLTGTLPPEYSMWTSITTFTASENRLIGSLPSGYKTWIGLDMFNVRLNALSGTLPPEYSSWTMLQYFLVYGNTGIIGTLPSEYASWSQIFHFHVNDANLTGPLPDAYHAMSTISEFFAANNRLSGTLPPSYSAWSKVIRFDASNNALEGTLPTQFSAWMLLSHFDVSGNYLSGTMPAEYGSWTSLLVFDVSVNHLSGTLPPEYSAWSRTVTFSAASNSLTGTLPREYSAFSTISVFAVSSNRLSGTLPSVFSTSSLASLLLDSNDFSGSLPASLSGGFLGVLALHNNSLLTGTIPSSMSIPFYVSMCNTSICGRVPASWSSTTWFCQSLTEQEITAIAYSRVQTGILRPLSPPYIPACPTPAPPPVSTTLAPTTPPTPTPAPVLTPSVALTIETQTGYPLIAVTTVAASTLSSGIVADGTAMDAMMVISAVAECSTAPSSESCAVGVAQPAAYLGALVGAVCAAAAVAKALGKIDAWRLPSRVSTLGNALVPMVLAHAVSLLGMPPSPKSGAVVLGVLGVCVCCALRLWFASRLTVTFPCRWIDQLTPKPKVKSLGCHSRVRAVVQAAAIRWAVTEREPGRWALDRSLRLRDEELFVERYGPLFENFVPARRWFSVAEWAVSCGVSVVTGLQLSCQLSCGRALPALGVLMILHSACAALQPHQRLLPSRWMVGSGVLRGVAGILMFVPSCPKCSTAATWLLRVCACGSGVVAVLGAVLLRLAAPCDPTALPLTPPRSLGTGSSERLGERRRSHSQRSSNHSEGTAVSDTVRPPLPPYTGQRPLDGLKATEALEELVLMICALCRTKGQHAR